MNRTLWIVLCAHIALLTAAAHADVPLGGAPPAPQSPLRSAAEPATPDMNFRLPVSLLNMMAPLSPDQKAKIQAIEDKLASDVAADKLTHDHPAAERSRSLANSGIFRLLTSAQASAVEGYKPMLLMLSKSMRISPEKLAAANITAEQFTKLSEISDDFNAQRTVIEGDHDQKIAQLNKDTAAKANAVLTPAQLDAINPAKRNSAGATSTPAATKHN